MRLSNQEREVFKVHVLPHLKGLHRLAFHRYHNECDVEEMVAETIAKPSENFCRLGDPSRIKAWLWWILSNAFFSHCREQNRFQAMEYVDQENDDGSEHFSLFHEVSQLLKRLRLRNKISIFYHSRTNLTIPNIIEGISTMKAPAASKILVSALLVMSLVGWSVVRAQEETKMERLADEPGHMMITPSDIKWVDGPASLPPGAKFAVIEGDLSKPEPITFRLKLPGDYKVAPHWHPGVEHVTVISGTLYLGAGDQLDPAKAKELSAGGFAVFPANRAMWGWTEEETVVQVHSIGPWGITYVNPADDPRKEAQ